MVYIWTTEYKVLVASYFDVDGAREKLMVKVSKDEELEEDELWEIMDKLRKAPDFEMGEGASALVFTHANE